MNLLLEDLQFELPDSKDKEAVLTAEFVHDKLKEVVEDKDLTRYIL